MRVTARFDLDIPALAASIKQDADTIQRKIALEIFARLLAVTPVDTGRARAGWSIDTRHGSYVPPKDESGYAFDRSMNVSPYMVPKNAPLICIYNNVEYILKLNEGTSTQAPEQFVETAVGQVMGGF
jgi:hypothetical protein